MWIKFVKNIEGAKHFDVVWTESDKDGQEMVNSGVAVRCLGPEGQIFEEAPPEDIVAQIAREIGKSVEQTEKDMEKARKKLSKDKQRKSGLGSYVPDEEIRP